MRNKVIFFSFPFTINSFHQSGKIFTLQPDNNIDIQASGYVDKKDQTSKVKITSAKFDGTDILPVLTYKGCWELFNEIQTAALQHFFTLTNKK